MLLWLKAFHIIAMVTWFAGLFYLPRLFVYHSSCDDQVSKDRFKIMEHKLYYLIMTPGAIVTVVLGLWMISIYGFEILLKWHWLQVKLVFVALLLGYHDYCGRLIKDFANDNNQHSEKFYRMINEVPVIPLIIIIIMAVVRPF
jgi:protoporphyrinogen IX oxidase